MCIIFFDINHLESIFRYDSNNINYVLYIRDIVIQYIQLKFTLKYTCVLFIETEVVFDSWNLLGPTL
jgi:hypothetical protein